MRWAEAAGVLLLAGFAFYFHKRQKGLIEESGGETKVDAKTLAKLPPASAPAPLAEASHE